MEDCRIEFDDVFDEELDEFFKDTTNNDNKGYPHITTQPMSVASKYCQLKDANPLSLFDCIQEAHQYQKSWLMNLACQTLASLVKGKSATEIKTTFIMDQVLDWTNNGQPSKSAQSSVCSIMRQRKKETLIKPTNFVYVQRSSLVTEALSYSYARRWKFNFDLCTIKLLNAKSDEDLLRITMAISSYSCDQTLADCLEHDHVVILFNILEQTSRDDIQSAVLASLSRVKFTAHEKAMEATKIQLLVKVINSEKVYGIYEYKRMHEAVFTLTNIAKALPKFVVDILKTDILERLKRVIVAHCTDEILDNIAMFLAAVCCSEDLSPLNKVDLARVTLQVLEASGYSEHYREQACHAFQYLTYGMELQIEESASRKLIEKLIMIIRERPRHDNCLYPGYALGVFGNIAIWGSFDQIEILASSNMFLESLEMVMKAGSTKIKKEACQIISNIAARKDGLIEEMKVAGLTDALCGLLEKDEFDVRMEAAWAIYNGIYGSQFSPSRPPPRPENDNQSLVYG